MEKGGHVYILANRRQGTLYTGVTSDLMRRVSEHRLGVIPGFAREHGVKRLVWHEAFGDIEAAIRREKQIKAWKRAWKIELIEAMNPHWLDLAVSELGFPTLGRD
jgi:putative endonuclease